MLSRKRLSTPEKVRKLSKEIEILICTADSRGYTGRVGSKGIVFDDPKIKKLVERRNALL
jgi:hypothetical protein